MATFHFSHPITGREVSKAAFALRALDRAQRYHEISERMERLALDNQTNGDTASLYVILAKSARTCRAVMIRLATEAC